MSKQVLIIFCISFYFGFSSIFFELRAGPVRVLIVDSPLDYKDVDGFLDEEFLRATQVIHGKESVTLEQLNSARLEGFLKKLRGAPMPVLYEMLNELNRVMGRIGKDSDKSTAKSVEELKRLKMVLRGFVKYFFSPRFRNQLNIVGNLIHGTHVAGLVVKDKGKGSVRLANYPLIGPMGESFKTLFALKFLLTLFSSEEKSSLQGYENLRKILQEGDFRIVNMSIGGTYKESIKNVRKMMGLVGWPLVPIIHWKMNRAMKARDLFYQSLFKQFPGTIFVVAAGNTGRLSSAAGQDLSAISNPNVVNVAATKFNGEWAKFSSYSNEHIELAAPGAGVESELAGPGKTIHLSGTSMATPIVTNRLVDIVRSYPDKNAQQIIQILLNLHTVDLQHLRDHVQNGRFLVPAGLVGASDTIVRGIVSEIRSQREYETVNLSNCRRAMRSL